MDRLMRLVGLLSVFGVGFLLTYAVLDFPDWGDPNSPASTHLSPHYIEKTIEETAVPNMVTAVLADYRAFDTMLETAVVFVAGIAIIAILRRRRRRPFNIDRAKFTQSFSQKSEEQNLIIRTTTRLLLPAIQIFALYVIAHGHHSPGGGFQGGVILAASLILLSLSFSLRSALANFSERTSLLFGNGGVLIFAGTGLLCLILGVNFLDYSILEHVYPATDAIMARSHSMLVVEIGVAFTVTTILYLIYANLASSGDLKRGL